MSATDRQNRLLVAEDWKRVYQSFKNADFQSYDFDNLRRTMINYLRENYPEDFNDYIESSEYLALIDLIAFLGQNLSFRIDLNARENFLELADRRESVLRLARLLSYNVKRNQAANGLLKFNSVTTTESIIDSNNRSLAGKAIFWNDPSNTDWFEQFTKVMNAALPVNGTFGRPVKKDTVAGIPTEQYRFNAINTDVPVYKFNKSVEGVSTTFEIVSTDINDGSIEEEIPLRANSLACLYRDDGRGAGSSNTGFFAHFRQGTLEDGTFTIDNPVPNQIIDINSSNVNNTDVWLYKLDDNGTETDFWTKVESVEGNNVIYNSLNKNIRNIYSVLTRADDRINLIFSDGVFGDLPKGTYKVYYRTSANRQIVIQTSDMQGITVAVPYLSRNGTVETLTITMSLRAVVDNGTTTETSQSIKNNAPSTYYTQNRMVTGEDYNVAPLGVSQEVVKVKSVNRTSSGISRYFDLIDTSGKYSSVNLYGVDGVIYKQELKEKQTFTFATQTDIEGIILNTIEPLIKNRKMLNFYYSKFPKIFTFDLSATWVQSTSDTNRSTGYFKDIDDAPYTVGSFTANSLKNIESGTLCKFIPPTGYYFDAKGLLKLGDGTAPGARLYKWTKVVSVDGRGITEDENGVGPIVFNDVIPSDAILSEVKPKLSTSITDSVKTQIVDQTFSYNTFGLRYDVATRRWRMVTNTNIDLASNFSTGKAGDVSNQNLDASWLILFQTNGESYTITYRGLRYIFESDKEIKFYYDSSDAIYNNKTGKIVKDKIQVMSVNTKPDTTLPFSIDYDWQVVEEFRDKEGYVDTKKIQISFFDSDDDGIVDDIDVFDQIVNELENTNEKFIFQKSYITADGVDDFRYVDQEEENINIVSIERDIGAYSQYSDGTVFYIVDRDTFRVLDLASLELKLTSLYRAHVGRDKLKFYYVHSADSNSRIDPAVSNIIDTYMLTRRYDVEYRRWLNGTTEQPPLPPSSDQLYRSFGKSLNTIKSISDEIIYHPVKYKVLFGTNAKEDLRAVFKIVKNNDLVVNDNDVKARVISAINQYFALENWEFGETFYFSELSTYIMNQVSPDLVSVVIVPVQTNQTFGSMFEIRSEADEVFVSGATVDDVEIIDAITATKLQAGGKVLTASVDPNTGIQSSALITNNRTSGGYSY
jgi:hypothetical protein